jgi:galactose mutarotase-like enzyme
MIVLEAGQARAMIALEGAEIKHWEIAGRPLLWEPNPAVWNETAPLLFPVVGWTEKAQVKVGERRYPLGLHGFARHRRFEILERERDRVRLRLASDPQTLALYPFDFSLIVEHRLSESGLKITLCVTNMGNRAMPYACGVHPGFRWPFAGGAATGYKIRFAEPEDPWVPEIAPGGFIGARKRYLPLDGTVLPLSQPDIFAHDALCFLYAKSKGLRFEAPDGAAIALEVEDFPHLALWCRPGNGYLCLEAWTGYSDPDGFSGDLYDKPSMRLLAPGENARHAALYSFST